MVTRRQRTDAAVAPARTMRAAAAWALTVLALGAAATSAQAAPSSDSVLVKVDPAAGPAARSDVGAALDADASRPLMAGWAAYDLPDPVTLAHARDLLSGEPAADAVALDQRLRAFEVPDDPLYEPYQWPLPTISAPAGWDAAAGAAPVTVAVIDTGVDTSHPDLGGRIWQNPGETPGNGIDDDHDGYIDDVNGWNFTGAGSNRVYDPADGDSHGTHVAGTIAARRGNGYGIAGIADNARIMPLKFLTPDGGYTSDAITAIQYAVARGAKVINASWGGDSYSAAPLRRRRPGGRAGRPVRGRGGQRRRQQRRHADVARQLPGGHPGERSRPRPPRTGSPPSRTTARRPVDVGAPGDMIASTLPGSAFGYKSGTSMAAPHVTGIAAVVRGLHPGFTPAQLKVGGGLGRPEHPGPGGDHGLRPARGPAGRHLGGRRRGGAGRDAARRRSRCCRRPRGS